MLILSPGGDKGRSAPGTSGSQIGGTSRETRWAPHHQHTSWGVLCELVQL